MFEAVAVVHKQESVAAEDEKTTLVHRVATLLRPHQRRECDHCWLKKLVVVLSIIAYSYWSGNNSLWLVT